MTPEDVTDEDVAQLERLMSEAASAIIRGTCGRTPIS